jgi:hypothetical protein
MFGDFTRQADGESFRVGTDAVSTVSFSSGEGYLRMTLETPMSTAPAYVITPEEEESKSSWAFPILKRATNGSLIWSEVEKLDAKSAAPASVSVDAGRLLP